MPLYLDYNASSPIHPEVLAEMIRIYQETPGNSDSRTHEHGENARRVIENARQQVAELLGANPSEVFFTSGSTESLNIAIQGLLPYGVSSQKMHILSSSIEHKAVLETLRFMAQHGFEVELVDPDSSGAVNADDLLSRVRDDTLLVCLMHVNNETGIIQPVQEVGHALESKEVLFLTDITQSCGKLIEEIREIP